MSFLLQATMTRPSMVFAMMLISSHKASLMTTRVVAAFCPVVRRRSKATTTRCFVSVETQESSSRFSMLNNKNLVSVQDCLDSYQLAQEQNQGLVFVDASWYHNGNRNGRAEFEQGPRITGAKYIDMDDIATSKELYPELNPKGLRVMLPPKRLFALAMDAFGIRNSDHIVIYGKEGTIFTPRTWFLFRTMGHDPTKVHLMQGSLEEWIQAGGAHETKPTTVPKVEDLDLFGDSPTTYQARDATQVIDMDEMMNIVKNESNNHVIVDPRGSSFRSNGHVPGSLHVPYMSLVEPDNWLKLKPKEQLLEVFAEAKVDVDTRQQIVCTCGSGVSVCHVMLALEECGRQNATDKPKTVMYDGSYQEWSMDPNAPKVLPSQE